MRKGILLIYILITTTLVYSQDPYIVTSTGLGQYGYVESSAVTSVRLNSSNHSNIDYMGARWWTGSEYIYNTPGFSNCGSSGLEGSTNNFSHADVSGWLPGEIAYVSVNAYYCGGGSNLQYNERQFREIETITTGYGGALAAVVDNELNVVGTFVINTGATALTLDRLWISNGGSAQEVDDLRNDHVKIYYEDVTGSETFDGSEANAILYGDYNGNSTSNEEFGHDDLNISISANTDLRIYIVVDDLAAGFTGGRTVQFSIMNDGISFEENMDGSFNLMRIEATDVSGSAIVLPVELTKFNATPQNNSIQLDWQTATEQDNSHFEVQHSINGQEFSKIGTIEGFGTTTEVQDYSFVDENPVNGQNYYRLKQVDFNGDFEYSSVIVAEFSKRNTASFYPNPTKDELIIENDITRTVNIQIYNLQGQLVRQFTDIQLNDKHQINLSNLNTGVYQLQLIDANSFEVLEQHRLIKQ